MRHPSIRVPVCLVRWLVRKPSVRRHGARQEREPSSSCVTACSAGVHDKDEAEELIGSVMMEGCVATTNVSDALRP